MSDRIAIISIKRPYQPGTPISVPEASQEAIDRANAESRRRIIEAYDTGMRMVVENLRDLLAKGWKPDRAGVVEFCRQVEAATPHAKRD